LSAPARSTEHLRWLPAKSNRCAASAACLGRSPKVAARNSCGRKISDTGAHPKVKTNRVCSLLADLLNDPRCRYRKSVKFFELYSGAPVAQRQA